jgi:hypothetical protein
MAKAKASPSPEALSTSPSLAQTLPTDAVLNALKMILLGASLNEVLTTITRLIEAHSTGMLCSIFLLDEDNLHLRYGVAASLPEAYRAATDGICSGPDVGSCGAAAYLRHEGPDSRSNGIGGSERIGAGSRVHSGRPSEHRSIRPSFTPG